MTHEYSLQQWAMARRGLWALGVLLLMALTAVASIHEVPEDYQYLQVALDACQAGDTVLVDRGTYYGQFQPPECSVHLYSHHVLTGDTMDVESTILDGEYGGPILSYSEGTPDIDVQGFTFLHGQGHYESAIEVYAGVVSIWNCRSLRVDHCVFRECQTDGATSAVMGFLFSSEGVERIQLTNCTLIDIEQTESDHYVNNNHPVILVGADSVFVKNIKAYTDSTSGFCVFGGAAHTSLEMENVDIRDMHLEDGTLLEASSELGATIKDVSFTNCSFTPPWNDGLGGMARFCMLHSDSLLMTIRNISFDSCSRTAHQGARLPGSDKACSITAMHMDADSILIRNCHTDTGGLMGIGDMYTIHERVVDRISNLRLEGCTYGQEEYVGDIEEPEMIGYLITFGGVDLVDCLFIDNVGMSNARPLGIEGRNNEVLSLMLVATGTLDSMRLSGLQFVNNLVISRDTYFQGRGWARNLGRSLYINAGCRDNPLVIMDSCQFIEQRQPNWIPEWDDAGMGNECGNAVYMRGYSSLLMRDCLFQGIDDGGLYVVTEGNILLQNCQFIDVDRSTCVVAAKCQESGEGGHLYLDNLYFNGGHQYDCQFPLSIRGWSWQVTLRADAETRAFARNCTITNSYPVSLAGFQYLGGNSASTMTLSNCLFSGNYHEYWNPTWLEPEHMFYNNCLLQESSPGENNLVGVDPLFDPILGAPFLTPDSPCIDAGIPDAAYNDIEDPEAPGFALWPSQGSLSNDIGYTGGPYAAVREFVGMSPKEEPPLPSSPILGDAYPNPFNPVTTIPFTLPQAGHFTLQAYNLRGQLVQSIADTDFPAGEHRVTLDGSALASGVYLIRLSGEGVAETRKALLLK